MLSIPDVNMKSLLYHTFLESQELINLLHLNEKTNDPRLADARSLAFRHLSSGAPIPMRLMDILDRYERRNVEPERV